MVSICIVLRSPEHAVPNPGHMHPHEYICLSKGVHLRLAIEEKSIFTYYLFPNSYTYNSTYYFQKIIMIIICLLLIISMNNHDKIFGHKTFQGYMFFCRNAEGVHGKKKLGNPCSSRWENVFLLLCLLDLVATFSFRSMSEFYMTLTQSCYVTGGFGMVLLPLLRLVYNPWPVATIHRPTTWLCRCILPSTLYHLRIL